MQITSGERGVGSERGWVSGHLPHPHSILPSLLLTLRESLGPISRGGGRHAGCCDWLARKPGYWGPRLLLVQEQDFSSCQVALRDGSRRPELGVWEAPQLFVMNPGSFWQV